MAASDGAPPRRSWAEVLGKNIPNGSWNRNVLEIFLEKDERGPYNVTHEECLKLMKKVGIDTQPGVQVEEIQICPNGRGIIFITLRKSVEISQFCRYDVIEVNDSGVRAVNFKPANKKDVVVTVRNIHPNTKDEVVIGYLNKFGKISNNKVVYGLYTEGPLKGFRNGNRSFKMELNPGSSLGTYHVIDGQKVLIKYPGQLQTCARCHQSARTCKGRGIAKRCEEEQGEKVDFVEYILALWKKIGYSPDLEELDQVKENEREASYQQQEGGAFTPAKVTSSPNLFSGVSVKGFPKDGDQSQMLETLLASGLPIHSIDDVSFKSNGTIIIKELTTDICKQMIDNLHGQIFMGKKVFCNGLVALTPNKNVTPVVENSSSSTCTSDQMKTFLPECPEVPLRVIQSSPCSSTENGSSSDIEQFLNEQDQEKNDEEFIRRHSLSMRSPHKGSLGAEILDINKKRSSLDKANDLLSEVKKLSARLSEYESCASTDDDCEKEEADNDDCEKEEADNEGFKSMNERKRAWRNKRKNSRSPTKDTFIKKQNTKLSPK